MFVLLVLCFSLSKYRPGDLPLFLALEDADKANKDSQGSANNGKTAAGGGGFGGGGASGGW